MRKIYACGTPPSPVNRLVHHISYLWKFAECSLSYLFSFCRQPNCKTQIGMRSAIIKSIKTYFYRRNSFCINIFNAFQRKIIKLRSNLSIIELSIHEKNDHNHVPLHRNIVQEIHHEAIYSCVKNHWVPSHKPRSYSLYTRRLNGTARHCRKRHEMESSTREHASSKRHSKHELYEVATGITLLQKTFFIYKYKECTPK